MAEQAITKEQGRAEVMDEIRKEQESGKKGQEQELTHYYKNILTLKNGKQIEICTRYSISKDPVWKGIRFIVGFLVDPLLIEKTVKFEYEEIAAIESIKDPCITQVVPWPESEEKDTHPENCTCTDCLPHIKECQCDKCVK